MKTKIIGLFLCMLLIATAVPAVESLKNSTINTTIPSTPLRSMAEDWTETQKLLASDGAAEDLFGYPVSLDGDSILIGAYADDDNGANSGAAYVFTRTGTIWTQQVKLFASDGEPNEHFGYSVSLDGDTALIGAIYDDDNGANSGSAYVFIRTGTTWTQQQKLLASDGAAGDLFSDIAVSLDGDTALIGANGDDGYKGSTYVFTRTGTTWTQQAKLLASDGAAGDVFGRPVSLDGDTTLIGARTDPGSVYVFIRTGTTWTQEAKLLTSGVGASFFVSLDEDTAVIGAYWDNASGVDSGSAYVFTRTGTIWTQQQKLLASDGAAEDCFGVSISLSGDTVLIGAVFDDDNGADSGSVYVFTRTGSTWIQQQKLLASDGAPNDMFGIFVSLDGNTAFIGAPRNDDNGYDSGSAYVYTNVNQPPIFGTPAPANGSTNNPLSLSWSIQINEPEGDLFSWTIQCSNGQTNSATGATNGTKTLALSGLASLTTYRIWVNATDPTGSGLYTRSWYNFTTKTNQPPTTPTITGPAKAKIKVATSYNFMTIDPDGDEVSYFIDWGDGTNNSWIGPYISGDLIPISHTWSKKGTYTIKAKAKDINGAESDWGTLSVTMPYKPQQFPLLEWLMDRFPNAFPILRHLFGY